MVGESYIVQESNNNKILRRVGKNLKVDVSPSGGYSQFNIEHMNKAKINNLTFPISTQSKKGKLSCNICQQRCEIMTKQEILNTYSNLDTEAVQRTRERIQEEYDDGIPYAYCTHCGKIYSTPETAIVPRNPKRTEICIKCMHEPDNLGRLKTLKPEKMNDIRDDPSSPKNWYWACRCGYRYLMENSNLQVQVFGEQQPKSFVRSIESSLDRSRKKLMNKEDVDDIRSLVDSRDIEPPGY